MGRRKRGIDMLSGLPEMGRRKRGIDMLSGLPDDVLCHILSFLPTWSSVRTSVLAKRWRFLWAHVPNLQFYERHFNYQTQPLEIINRVAMLHKGKALDTFSFRLSSRKDCAYQLETLIIYLIKRCVRNLNLHFDTQNEDDTACPVPRLLFTCKTLVDLSLAACGVIPSTGQLFLPSLKKLSLYYVEYEDDESLPHLLSGCPVLEKLIIRSDQYNPSSVTISSPTIKTLTVDLSGGSDYIPNKMLILDVPALVYLRVSCYDFEYVKSLTKTMTSLIGAEIALDNKNHTCDIDCTKHACSIEFLSCLCHVRHLKFSSVSFLTLSDMVGTGSMPKFVNLTKLEFNATVDWYNVVKFIEVADNLEVLVITLSELPRYKEPKRVPPCMLSRLRTVKMYYFSASEDAFDLVRYILRSAQVLERMEISPTSRFSKVKFDALQRISLFERVSKSCQVAFGTVKSPRTIST